MHVTARLNAVIRSSRRRMQAGPSQSVEKSERPTGVTVPPRKPQAEHINTEQQKYTDEK
mgnify:FL=1